MFILLGVSTLHELQNEASFCAPHFEQILFWVALFIFFKTDWQILADFHSTPRSGAAGNLIYPVLLSLLNEIRTFYQDNPDFEE